MSPDQIAPQRLPALVEAFAQTAHAILDLARSCSDDNLRQPTECPGWTVHDQLAHVAGVEALLGGHRDPRVELPHYDHIKNDLGKKVEFAVQVRRGRTGTELVAELESVLAQRLATLRDPALTDSSIIAGPFGPQEAVDVMLLRIFDLWTHEQDIRCALGRPGDLDSPAAAICVRSVMGELPKLLARGAALEPGHLVVIEVSGPTAARQGFRVELDAQGRARGHAVSADPVAGNDALPGNSAFPGTGAQGIQQLPDGGTTTISLSTEAFTRRATGRRSVSETSYDVIGDPATAQRVLEGVVVTH